MKSSMASRILFLMILLNLNSCSNFYSTNNIYGVWKGQYEGKEISFVFDTDNACTLSYWEKSSQSFQTINGDFELDFSKKPVQLNIRNIPQMNHPLYTILEFVTVDSFRIAEFAPRWRVRPISFHKDKTIILNRVRGTD